MQQLISEDTFIHANKQKESAIISSQVNWLILDAAACPEPLWFAKGTGTQLISLFNSQDVALQDYGAWLINVIDYPDIVRLTLNKDTAGCAALWCSSLLDAEELAQQLRFRLYATLPDGITTRFRWYDPRVLDSWLASLSLDRRIAFLEPINEILYTPPNPFYSSSYLTCWHPLIDGSYSCRMVNLAEYPI